jgi:hypothetical protein
MGQIGSARNVEEMVSPVECKKRMIVPIIGSWLVGRVFLTMLLSTATDVRGELWICPQVDGTDLYSDQELNSRCRKMENVPPLIRAPIIPRDPETQAKPERKFPGASEPSQVPISGRGRQIDPPSDAAITIYLDTSIASDVASVRVQNIDSEWTAKETCLTLLYHIVAMSSSDVTLRRCIGDLRPAQERVVTFPGSYPEQCLDVSGPGDCTVTRELTKVELGSVNWVRIDPQVSTPGQGIKIDQPSDAAISVRILNSSSLLVQNLDSDWTAHQVCVDILYHVAAMSSRDVHLKKCLSDLKPMEERKLSVSGLPSEASVDSVDWVR